MHRSVHRTSHATLLRAASGIALSAICLAIVFFGVDLTRTWEVIASASWILVLAAGLAIALDIGMRAWRWQVLLRPVRSIAYGSVLRHTLIGCLANNVLPARLGEVARSVSLGEREGISRATVLGTVIVERILDTAVLALVATGAIAVLGVHGVVADAVFVGLALAVGLATLLVGTLAVRLLPPNSPMRALLARHARVARLGERLHRGLAVAADPGTVARGAILSVLAWGVGTGAFWLAAAAVGVSLSIPQAALLTAAVSLATAIPSGPGYLGSFELAAVTVLAVFGVPPAPALAAAILVHATILLVSSTGGALAVARSGLVGGLLGPRGGALALDPTDLRVGEPTLTPFGPVTGGAA